MRRQFARQTFLVVDKHNEENEVTIQPLEATSLYSHRLLLAHACLETCHRCHVLHHGLLLSTLAQELSTGLAKLEPLPDV